MVILVFEIGESDFFWCDVELLIDALIIYVACYCVFCCNILLPLYLLICMCNLMCFCLKVEFGRSVSSVPLFHS